MWEIFSRCREKPYGSLTDEDVLENIKHMSATSTLKVGSGHRSFLGGAPYFCHLQHRLDRPVLCPERVFANVVFPCWQYEPQSRPSFEAVHHQLQMLIHTRMT